MARYLDPLGSTLLTVRLYSDKWQPKKFPADNLHPTVLLGFVWGGKVRWESQRTENVDGRQEVWPEKWFLINQEPVHRVTTVSEVFSVSNLQKQSVIGFLLFKPFLFRVWFMPKKQMTCAHGGHVPNSELGLDIRFPGWRKDYAGHQTTDSAVKRFWDWTFGRIGIHWD